jgi:8-oxo-dGTP pyrophosphatase MutT (NUDIX family)
MKQRQAAVAVVVAPCRTGDELLVLRRATVVGDPWSGHIALPGGGNEPFDTSLEETARRETLEETGIDLSHSHCIATLACVTPQSPAAPIVTIAPFVFRYSGDKAVRMSREIVESWWIPVAEFQRESAWQTATITTYDGVVIDVRGFQCRGHVLWGLTARIVEEFLSFGATDRPASET